MIQKSLVIKLGSEIFRQNRAVNKDAFQIVAKQATNLLQQGVAVTIVSSFAIRLGEIWLRDNGFQTDITPPILAAVGQPKLMGYWDKVFLSEKVATAQILISDASLMHRDEWQNVGDSIRLCHERGIVPIINANDPVSWSELQRYKAQTSDNDFVTAQVVPHINATDVLFGTKVGGVYHPTHHDPDAKLYAEISWQNPPKVDVSPATNSNGGMGPKIANAIICYEQGKRNVAITRYDSILRFGAGERVPTMIGSENRFA